MMNSLVRWLIFVHLNRHCFSDFASFTEYFYRTHDPTTLNSQGVDLGTRAFHNHLLCPLLMYASRM